MKKDIEELKKTYPRLWQKACKKFKSEKGRERGFLALIEVEKAKLRDLVEREKERKRKNRALILWAKSLIKKLSSPELEGLIVLTKDELKAKEGKKIIDYLPFLIAEIREQHTDFKLRNEKDINLWQKLRLMSQDELCEEKEESR